MSAGAEIVWKELLDAYERTLDEQELMISDTNGVLEGTSHVAFTPPVSVEPIPESMRQRADTLMQRTSRLIERVRILADASTPLQPAPQRAARRGSSGAPSFDLKA